MVQIRTRCQSVPTAVTATALVAMLMPVGSAPAEAQTPDQGVVLETPIPPSLILPNYNRVLIGETEALEAGAFVARADGPVAAFYNPAGLGLATASSFTAGLSTQEWIKYSVKGGFASNSRTSNRTIGGVFGVVLGPEVLGLEKWRFGFLLSRPVSIQPALELRSTVPTGTGSLSATYVTTSSMSDLAPTVAAAYNYSPTLRFGGAIRLSTLSLYQNQTQFADILEDGSLRVVEGTLFGNGSVWSLLLTGGMQWEPRRHVMVGVQFALPSMRLFGSSSNIYRGADLTESRGVVLRFADSDTEFRYRQPLSVSAGIAWTGERGSVEFSLKQHAATGRYDVFKTNRPVERTIVTSENVIVDEVSFPDFRYKGRAVTNISVGGSFRFGPAVTAHGGVYTDRSPVGSEAQSLFTRLNLVGITGGAAINFRGFVGSVGLAYITGEREISVTLATATVEPTVRVRSLQLLYALGYTF